MLNFAVFILFAVSEVCGLHVSGILSANRLGSVPLGVSLGAGVLDVEGVCGRGGVACVNCTHAVTCVAVPAGYLRVPLETCEGGSTCNARAGGCSPHPVPECTPESENFHHVCEQVGVFPDAIDCRKFHFCSPPEDYPHGRPADHRAAYCPRHYGYDPLTAQCKIRLAGGQCDQTPTPSCSRIGQNGPLSGSPHHYYVCLSKGTTLYPQIFLCPHGFYFYNNFCNAQPSNAEVGPEINVENTTTTENTEATTTEKLSTILVTSNPLQEVVSTTEYPVDKFLSDKFDLSQYESQGDSDPYRVPDSYEFSSVESY